MGCLTLLASKLTFSKAHSFDGWLQSLENSNFLRAKVFFTDGPSKAGLCSPVSVHSTALLHYEKQSHSCDKSRAKKHFIMAWSLLQCLKHIRHLIISLWIIYFVNYLWSFRALVCPSSQLQRLHPGASTPNHQAPLLPLPTILMCSGNANSF